MKPIPGFTQLWPVEGKERFDVSELRDDDYFAGREVCEVVDEIVPAATTGPPYITKAFRLKGTHKHEASANDLSTYDAQTMLDAGCPVWRKRAVKMWEGTVIALSALGCEIATEVGAPPKHTKVVIIEQRPGYKVIEVKDE